MLALLKLESLHLLVEADLRSVQVQDILEVMVPWPSWTVQNVKSAILA